MLSNVEEEFNVETGNEYRVGLFIAFVVGGTLRLDTTYTCQISQLLATRIASSPGSHGYRLFERIDGSLGAGHSKSFSYRPGEYAKGIPNLQGPRGGFIKTERRGGTATGGRLRLLSPKGRLCPAYPLLSLWEI
jgi:hypothetical protein